MAGLTKNLKDEYGILKILAAALIVGSVTYVFLGVASGFIAETTTVIKPDGSIEVKTNTAVAVGITLFNAVAGGAIMFLFQERAKRATEEAARQTSGPGPGG